jgi:predicted acetyltransferase
MHLRGINTDGYALYQTARTIMLEREYIKLSEIADKALVGDIAFKAIINGVLISKYGSTMLNLND